MNATYHLSIEELKGDFLHDLEERFGNAPVELTVGPSAAGYRLPEDQFWEFISHLDWKKMPDELAVVEPLVKKLAAAPVRYIYDFYDWLSEKLYGLDGEKYAVHIGKEAFVPGKPFSADHFLDVRSCVVANGKKYYLDVLRHPKTMPKDRFFEMLPYVPSMAYERKKGKTFDYPPRYNYLTFSNKEGWGESVT